MPAHPDIAILKDGFFEKPVQKWLQIMQKSVG